MSAATPAHPLATAAIIDVHVSAPDAQGFVAASIGHEPALHMRGEARAVAAALATATTESAALLVTRGTVVIRMRRV